MDTPKIIYDVLLLILKIKVQIFKVLGPEFLFISGNNGILPICGNIDKPSAESGHADDKILMFFRFFLSRPHFSGAHYVELNMVDFKVFPGVHVGLPDVKPMDAPHDGH